MTKFISYAYLAMTIIKIKNSMFGKNCITRDEFNYIQLELQKEFNKENKDMIIHSDFGMFDLDDIKVDGDIITIASDPLTKYVLTSTSLLADYTYIILELIIEYAEKELEEQKEKFDKFKSESNTFEEKQKNILKKLQN